LRDTLQENCGDRQHAKKLECLCPWHVFEKYEGVPIRNDQLPKFAAEGGPERRATCASRDEENSKKDIYFSVAVSAIFLGTHGYNSRGLYMEIVKDGTITNCSLILWRSRDGERSTVIIGVESTD